MTCGKYLYIGMKCGRLGHVLISKVVLETAFIYLRLVKSGVKIKSLGL